MVGWCDPWGHLMTHVNSYWTYVDINWLKKLWGAQQLRQRLCSFCRTASLCPAPSTSIFCRADGWSIGDAWLKHLKHLKPWPRKIGIRCWGNSLVCLICIDQRVVMICADIVLRCFDIHFEIVLPCFTTFSHVLPHLADRSTNSLRCSAALAEAARWPRRFLALHLQAVRQWVGEMGWAWGTRHGA